MSGQPCRAQAITNDQRAMMARPRLELGTPRFSEVRQNRFNSIDLQEFYW
jgi:hypothetical protein